MFDTKSWLTGLPSRDTHRHKEAAECGICSKQLPHDRHPIYQTNDDKVSLSALCFAHRAAVGYLLCNVSMSAVLQQHQTYNQLLRRWRDVIKGCTRSPAPHVYDRTGPLRKVHVFSSMLNGCRESVDEHNVVVLSPICIYASSTHNSDTIDTHRNCDKITVEVC
jgi:hypothetical protein